MSGKERKLWVGVGQGWHGAGIRHSVAGSGEQATSSHATAPDGG